MEDNSSLFLKVESSVASSPLFHLYAGATYNPTLSPSAHTYT